MHLHLHLHQESEHASIGVEARGTGREDEVLYKTGGRGIRDMGGGEGIPCGREATVLEPGDRDGYETDAYHVGLLQTVALPGDHTRGIRRVRATVFSPAHEEEEDQTQTQSKPR